jgi:hypothetical protein
MNAVSKIITTVLDVLLVPFGRAQHTLGLVWLSLLTGVAMAYVFKATSDERAIRRAKNRFTSYILEMRIYQDDLRVVFGSFFRALSANVLYLRSILKPVLVLIIPVVLVFMQLDERYGRSQLSPGSTTVLTLRLARGADLYEPGVSIACSPGAAVDAGPVRIFDTREIAWRIRIASPGTHSATIVAGGFQYSLPIVAEPSYRMIGHSRSTSPFFEPLLHPALPAISRGSPIESVRIHYPGASYPFLFWDVHWIVLFIVYSLIAALAMKLIVGFEI